MVCAARLSVRSASAFSSGTATVAKVRVERACSSASMRLPAAAISALQLSAIRAGVSAKSILRGAVRGSAASAERGSSASAAAAAIEPVNG